MKRSLRRRDRFKILKFKILNLKWHRFIILGCFRRRETLTPSLKACSWTIIADFFGEAIKGVRWMPWLQKATKDVANCDKLGRGVYDL